MNRASSRNTVADIIGKRQGLFLLFSVHQACRTDNLRFSFCLYNRHDSRGLFAAMVCCAMGAETLNGPKPLVLARLSEKPVKEEEEVGIQGWIHKPALCHNS